MRVVGTVTVGDATYTLLADRSWRVMFGAERLTDMERTLAAQYSGDEWFGPAQGMFGAMVLHDLAHEIGGEVSYEAQHEPADTVA